MCACVLLDQRCVPVVVWREITVSVVDLCSADTCGALLNASGINSGSQISNSVMRKLMDSGRVMDFDDSIL